MHPKDLPSDVLDGWNEDDGTIVKNVADLANKVVGHRIVSVEQVGSSGVIKLDNGTTVNLISSSDCCAYTDLDDFLLHADSVDHIITGVSTEGGYTRWHIYADMGDVLELQVGWSCGNPFYYGYGFYIDVEKGEE